MNRYCLSVLALVLACTALSAQTIDYKGEKVQLGPHSFYVDGALSDAEAAASPYIFNSFNEAAAKFTDGTVSDPMRVYIAPWVYWIDDPDDPEIRRNPAGGTPIGLTVRCESLQLLGICTDPRDVVLASARGQTQGAVGNFTMFDFYGDDLVVRDLTMGNYCNIDLEYPRKPELGRLKRNSAITQAQLAFSHGDRVYVENVRFMARLNLCPLNGAKRILFVGCHFESTDDSLAGNGIYLGCDLDFWGRQPFGSVDRYGTVFLDSDFNVKQGAPVQAVSKSVGRASLIDVRYHAGGRQLQLAWTLRPEEWLRCYEYNITLDSQPAFVGAEKPYNTVCLEQKAQLSAFRLVDDDGTVLYNTYNLLRGEDDWDPQGIKDKVLALGRRDGRDYADVATCLDLNLREAGLQTGGETLALQASLLRHGGYKLDNQVIRWKVQPGFERFASLSATEGRSCSVTATNREDLTRTFDIIAYTDDGLECAVELTVAPDFIEAPVLASKPVISISGGIASVDYPADFGGREDGSLVTWYRCDDGKGGGAVPVSVSRGGEPRKTYSLHRDDVGHYLMVGVAPKHIRCEAGAEVRTVYNSRIKTSMTDAPDVYSTDFSDFPTDNQLSVRPGYWTVDAFKPGDTSEYSWTVDLTKPCWTYGSGINGAKGLGLQQVQQGARLRYTPPIGKYGDMSVTWRVDPAKDGGQGFASARQQYLDLFIKFDTSTLTGYALRVIRTTKFANAVDVLLVKYTGGRVEPISESVSTDCFLTGCVLTVGTSGGKISAHVEGPTKLADPVVDPRIHNVVDIEAPFAANPFGGFGLQHTSTVGSESRIMIHSVQVDWL